MLNTGRAIRARAAATFAILLRTPNDTIQFIDDPLSMRTKISDIAVTLNRRDIVERYTR